MVSLCLRGSDIFPPGFHGQDMIFIAREKALFYNTYLHIMLAIDCECEVGCLVDMCVEWGDLYYSRHDHNRQ